MGQWMQSAMCWVLSFSMMLAFVRCYGVSSWSNYGYLLILRLSLTKLLYRIWSIIDVRGNDVGPVLCWRRVNSNGISFSCYWFVLLISSSSTEVEQSILEDLRSRVQLSSVALPSVSLYNEYLSTFLSVPIDSLFILNAHAVDIIDPDVV